MKTKEWLLYLLLISCGDLVAGDSIRNNLFSGLESSGYIYTSAGISSAPLVHQGDANELSIGNHGVGFNGKFNIGDIGSFNFSLFEEASSGLHLSHMMFKMHIINTKSSDVYVRVGKVSSFASVNTHTWQNPAVNMGVHTPLVYRGAKYHQIDEYGFGFLVTHQNNWEDKSLSFTFGLGQAHTGNGLDAAMLGKLPGSIESSATTGFSASVRFESEETDLSLAYIRVPVTVHSSMGQLPLCQNS